MNLTRISKGLLFLAVPAFAATAVFAGQQPASGEQEALARVISKWDSDCSGGQRDSWDDMVKAWYDEITNSNAEPNGHGSTKAFWKSGFYHNKTIVDSDFTDADEVSWGNDDGDDRLDAGDAYMVGLHGGNNSNNHRWYGKVRVDESGSGNCYAYQGHIVLGDYDLEFLHLSSCYSMDREDWWDEWNDTFDELHRIDAFHGIMWISSSYTTNYKDFADDAFDMNLTDAWIDNLYKVDVADGDNDGVKDDMCPVSRGVGEDESDVWSRMDNECYTNVYSDPPGLGSSRTHGAYYIQNCDPAGKGPLD